MEQERNRSSEESKSLPRKERGAGLSSTWPRATASCRCSASRSVSGSLARRDGWSTWPLSSMPCASRRCSASDSSRCAGSTRSAANGASSHWPGTSSACSPSNQPPSRKSHPRAQSRRRRRPLPVRGTHASPASTDAQVSYAEQSLPSFDRQPSVRQAGRDSMPISRASSSTSNSLSMSPGNGQHVEARHGQGEKQYPFQ